jgi:hypothetical protein
MTDTIDSKIGTLLEELRKRQQDVKQAERESQQKWQTNCSFTGIFPKPRPINLQTATPEGLKAVVRELIVIRNAELESSAILEQPADYSVDGYSIDAWLADCKKRAAIQNLREKQNKLEQLQTRLDAIVSPEQKRQMELDAISKEFDGM